MEAVRVLSPCRFHPGSFVVYVVCSLRVNLQSVVSLLRALSWAWATLVHAQQQEVQVRHGQTPLPFAHVLAPRHGQTSPPLPMSWRLFLPGACHVQCWGLRQRHGRCSDGWRQQSFIFSSSRVQCLALREPNIRQFESSIIGTSKSLYLALRERNISRAQ